VSELRFGFPCIPLGLEQPFVRTCKLANATPERLEELVEGNLDRLEGAIDYAADRGFGMFRIHSDTIVFGSHPVNTLDWRKLFKKKLRAIGARAKARGLRLSMHPGQFTLLNSPKEDTTRNAIAELRYHAAFLDALGTGTESKIVIHVGGVYGDKPAAIARFEKRWRGLPRAIRTRVVIENDEFSYSIFDALALGERLKIPVVFDRFHHRVHGDPSKTPVADILRRAVKTWKAADGRPKVHFSSQEPGERPGTHGAGIRLVELRAFFKEAEGMDLDVMIESKGKEKTAGKALAAYRKAVPAARSR
jgi:UV DNA damage endonuclease